MQCNFYARGVPVGDPAPFSTLSLLAGLGDPAAAHTTVFRHQWPRVGLSSHVGSFAVAASHIAHTSQASPPPCGSVECA